MDQPRQPLPTREPSLGTILARAGGQEGTRDEPQPLSPPLDLASVHRFRDLDQVNEVWEGRRPGYIYRRFGHSNAAALEKTVATLEEAEDALACSSGMGALFAVLAGSLQGGEHIVAQEGLYGGTQALLSTEFARLGVGLTLVAEPRPEQFADALDGLAREGRRVKILLVETISNPSLKVADLPRLSELARERGLVLVVDNTFATPLACRPLRWGPALVLHSATKYLNGHSDAVAGLVAGPAALVGPARRVAIATGVTIAPFDAWLTLRGLKTLHLRFARQQENAARAATWLAGRPGVARVLYPGLANHPTHATATRVLEGFGAMVSFELGGGEAAAAAFIRRLEAIAFAPSLGETATTVSYPALTSHRSLSVEEKERAGAGPGVIRLSLGIEDIADVLAELELALG